MEPARRIRAQLNFLYGEDQAERVWPRLLERVQYFRQRNRRKRKPRLMEAASLSERLTEKDAILITYGDQVTRPGEPALQTLSAFLNEFLKETISGVHILPFYPYTSDDGFSVIDYRQVDPALGSWQDISSLGRDFRLMFDAVINHVSRESDWFRAFQRGEPPYSEYFITVEPGVDLSQVVRPRALPLLTPVETSGGLRHVWTTFSDDQIDLNYANPQVLLEIVDVLLFYVEHGAEILRLDAIAYLWKETGTPCIHLSKTHAVIKLLRAVLDAVAPGTILITETNVPHLENISYFGTSLPETGGTDEAQMVYQFPLAPLVLHAFKTGSALRLSQWAAGLQAPGPFFNFIASHDGMGVLPARGLLSEADIQGLAETALAHGGQVSYRFNPDGSRSVYELNITLFDALNDPKNPQPGLDRRRFLAAQTIMLSLAGVPGIYFHSLLGSRNCHACVERTGRLRSINREKFNLQDLAAALGDANSRQAGVFAGFQHLLSQRREHPAFHPLGAQQVLTLNEAVFALLRSAPSLEEKILCLINVSSRRQDVHLAPGQMEGLDRSAWLDLIGGQTLQGSQAGLALSLHPYQCMWLRPVE